jgi:spermidine/putrescine transport system substrate-binding protein
MKYLFYTFLIITSLFSEQRVLKISNFIDYINIDLLKEFAYQNDIKIIYDIHEVNEEIYSKIKENNDFDLLILSSNYITKLAKIDKLEKIDISKLKNYSNINQEFLQTNFSDTKEFTIPYLWGTVGLIYNKKLIKEPITQWNDLW